MISHFFNSNSFVSHQEYTKRTDHRKTHNLPKNTEKLKNYTLVSGVVKNTKQLRI